MVSAATSERRGHPMAPAAASPMIGVIKGATSMAPMTTAAEFDVRPSTAMMTEAVSMNP